MQDDERVSRFLYLFLQFLTLLSVSSALNPWVAAQGLPSSPLLARTRHPWPGTPLHPS